MKYIESMSKDDLELLLSKHNGPCMSIFMPTHFTGPDIRQDPIRLKNILHQAEQKIIESGLYSPKVKEILLKPIMNLIEQEQFWRFQSKGLAIFVSQDIFEYFRLPFKTEELVVITNNFHIKPLLPLFRGDGKFYLLAISLNLVRFFECTHYTVKQIYLEGMPLNLDDALKYDDESGKPTFSHSFSPHGGSGGSTGLVHGQILGSDTDYEKKEILNFFQRVNDSLHIVLKNQKSPLLLATVDRNFPIYKEANSYPYMIDEIIHGNPDTLTEHQLHDKGWKIVNPLFKQTEKNFIERFNQLSNVNNEAKWISYELEEIIPASYYGQVEALFIAENEQQWGKFDPDTNVIHLHQEERTGDQDLLDLAAVNTYTNGGNVYVVSRQQVPGTKQIAALFRYPSAIRTTITIR